MLRGSRVGLPARHATDTAVPHAEIYDDVATRSRADSRAWRPIPPDSSASPYRVAGPAEDAACFSVVELDREDLAGDALLRGIDVHNERLTWEHRRGRRSAAEGWAPTWSGCCATTASWFSDRTGCRSRPSSTMPRWVAGAFADETVMGLLASEWSTDGPEVAG
jgi:hypothetical protein